MPIDISVLFAILSLIADILYLYKVNMTNNSYAQVNVNITRDDLDKLTRLMADDDFVSRSAFVRRLIRQEWMRRYQPVQMVAVEPAGESTVPNLHC